MFAWSPIPEPFKTLGSVEFSKLLVEKAEVAVSPGTGFGERGEGFVRIALVENEQRIRQAARNIRRFLESGAGKVAQRGSSRHAAVATLSIADACMVAPLKVGLAGLGTVGASVVRLIDEQRQALALRCGRPIEVVAVSARSRGKDRGIDIEEAALGRRSGRSLRAIPASTCSSS